MTFAQREYKKVLELFFKRAPALFMRLGLAVWLLYPQQ